MNDDINLDEVIPGTMFTWRQCLTQGNTGVVVTPTPEQKNNIIKQANALVPVYSLLGGFVITSFLRSIQHNSDVGGSPKSAHLLGLATDFVPSHCTPEQARQMIRVSGVYPGRTELDSTTWNHYDLTGTKDFYGRPKP